ncbi:hypothetical protein BLA28_27945 [Eisenbergiella tayi]|uniref:Stage 0 sporulation protein A homolog n=1 Tax=Eisenbergiella tayi TaxID=1432052 RepID=A0A1E3A0A9_9FIRM|nr:helix-turn-helix domain-containing protein [Eisenbergiella tayi]ODM02180.1 putative response regulatory protein [Eisenbergiella tayi]OIZ60767.1 hypothetical protein BLA28_27945 [Eisenbergiella tayi]
MNKVLLIDDEILSIEYLKSLDAWELFDCEITGYALTVSKAMELFKREKPEIVFVDIRMPRMDGLELSRKLLEICPDTNIVIMTAYQEFEYVKEAIQIGISYFLVKHEIDNDKLEEVLRKIEGKISSKAHYEKVMWNDWLRSVWEEAREGKKAEEGPAAKGWMNPSSDYFFVLMSLRSWSVFMGEEEVSYLKESDFCFDTLPDIKIKAFTRLEDYTYGIAAEYNRPSSWSMYHKDRMSFFGELEKRSRILAGKQAVCYFSSSLKNGSDLLEACGRLKKMPQSFLWKRKLCLEEEDYRRLEEIVPDCLLQKNYGYLERDKDIAEWLDMGKNANWYVREENVVFFRSIVEELKADRFLKRMDSEIPVVSAEQVLKGCRLFLEKGGGKNTADDKAEKAAQYIMSHYAEDLSSSVIAEKLNVSDGYLRYIFKQRYSCTVKEYIMYYRIEAAKKLLDEDRSKIYEVAEQCGFTSSQHFCRVFHQLTGISPGEYKSR